MPWVCEAPGCPAAAAMSLGGHQLCSGHGDTLIDRLREAQVAVNHATYDQVATFLDEPGKSKVRPR